MSTIMRVAAVLKMTTTTTTTTTTKTTLEKARGLDINEVPSIHRQSKPKVNKHLHMFINDYYQPDAGVNHDGHHLYLHKLDKN